MLDDFSAAYIAKYEVAGFDNPKSKIVLSTSGAINENGHCGRQASLRRMLKSVVKTHMLNKANMSAQVVGRSWAKRHQRAGGRGVVSVAATRQKTSELSNVTKRRAGRSAWTTFISEQSAGKKADFRELSDKYRNISHEEYQRLQARGSLVGLARGEKRKHRAFVTPRLQARQQAQTKLRTEQWPHCQHERSQTRVLESMLVIARATGGKMVNLPKEAILEARFNMAMERARAKERERAIQEFRQTTAGDVRASILHHSLSIDTLADDFLCTPDLGCVAWEFAPDVSTQCEKVI